MLRSSSKALPGPRRVPLGRLAAAKVLPASLATVVAVRVGLSLSSLTQLRSRMLPSGPLDRDDLVQAGRVAWGVRVVSRFVPFASCLTRAQAGQILLARRGIPSTLCLGVRTGRHSRVEAHAWLTVGKLLVLGDETADVSSFRLLTELGPTAR